MMKRRGMALISGLLCLLLVGLTGCQIAGQDISAALQNAVNMQSYEGDAQLSIDFTGDGSGKPMEIGGMDVSSLGKVDLQITSMKQSAPNLTSLSGQLTVSNHKIPFAIQLDHAQLALYVDNNTTPIVFKLDALLSSSIKMGDFDISSILATVLGDPNKLETMISTFVIAKLPDPKTGTVDAVKEQINNESVDLQKLHTELNSKEAADLVKSLLQNILDDKSGIKALVSDLYKAFFQTSTNDSKIDFSSIAIDSISQALIDQLQQLVDNFDTTANGLINDKTSLKTDLYIDGAKQLRKLGMELNLGSLPLTVSKGIGSVKLSGSAEFWNINKAAADPVKPIPANAFNWEGNSKMAHMLKFLGTDSQVYQWFMNDLHVTRKEIKMVIPASDGSGVVKTGDPYISTTDRTMVPVRYVSEQLDSDVKWDGAKQEVTITDILSGKTIVLTIGSNVALVDGVETSLGTPASPALLNSNGSTYVPVAFIASSLGAKPGWDQATHTVTLSKQ
jgi:hypothetical protein